MSLHLNEFLVNLTCLRHCVDRNLQVSLHLNEFLVNYWVSHTRHSGVEVHGRRLALLCGLQMNLVPPDDTAGLIVSNTSITSRVSNTSHLVPLSFT